MIPIRDANPSSTRPVVTIAIVIVNFGIFLYELSLGPHLDQFLIRYGLVPSIVTGAYHVAGMTGADIAARFGTSMFLHGGWLHVIGNMWYLWIFGDNVEDRLGHVPYLFFYLACGVGSGVIDVWSNPTSTMPTIGASGAIAGVLGAYLITFPRARIMTLVPIFILPLFINLPAVFVLGAWFVVQLFNGTAAIGHAAQTTGGVAWWAHIGGFTIGMVLMKLLPRRRRPRPPEWRYGPVVDGP